MHLQSGFQYDGAVLDVFRLLKKTRTPTKKGGGAGRVKKHQVDFVKLLSPPIQTLAITEVCVLRM